MSETPFTSSVRHPAFVIRHWALCAIVIVQTLLCSALALSLCWNVWQASDASARVQEAYRIGVDDGAALLRVQIIRSILQRQIIEEQHVKDRGKL